MTRESKRRDAPGTLTPPSPPAPSPPARAGRVRGPQPCRVRWAALLIVAAGLLAYANSFTGPFALDDIPAIVDNPTIRSLWPVGPALSPRAGTAGVEGRPVLNLTFAVNYALGGLDVRGYRAVNVAIHLLAGLLLFGLVRRTLILCSPEPSAEGLALAIALLWVVHPLQTESVTYVVQRAESLGGLLTLLCLYSVVRGAEADSVVGCRPARIAARSAAGGLSVVRGPEVGNLWSVVCSLWSSPARRWYLLAIAACAVGMGTKESMLVVPFLVLVYDRLFLASCWREVIRRRAGLYVGLAASLAILVALMSLQRGAYMEGRPETLPIAFSLELLSRPAALIEFFRSRLWSDVEASPWTYFITQPAVIANYIRLAFWPDDLCLYYNWPFAKSVAEVRGGLAVLAAALAVNAWALVRYPRVAFVGVWFFFCLAPSSSLLPTDDAAFEHRMYLPLAAVLTAAVAAGFALTRRWPRARAVVVALIVVTLGVRTLVRNHDYRSTLALWEATLRVRPDNPMAYHNLGVERARLGQIDQALADLTRLVAMQPENAEGHASLADVLARAGRPAEALEHFATAVRLRPSNVNARIGLANLLLMQGESATALEHLRLAVQLRPDLAEAQSNLGIALCALGQLADGLPHLAEAVRLKPGSAESRNNLGRALMLLGRLPEAEAQLAEAVRLKPDYVDAMRNLEAVRRKAP